MTLAEHVAESDQEFLHDYWYPACASSRLRKAPLATRILDRDLVIFRAERGEPAALTNRCPHRGVQLSLGRVNQGAIACRYHGWRYDQTGRCVKIPSSTAERIPAACRVPAFACVETHGYVWVWVGDAAPPSPPPPIEGFESRGWVQGSMPMRCSWLAGVENNLDWCHPAFAHRWTHPQFYTKLLRGSRETAYELRPTDTGLAVFSPPASSEAEPIPEQPAVLLTFELPNRVTVKIAQGRLTIILHFVPTGESSCRMEWMRSTFIGRSLRWTRWPGLVNLQDRKVLESAQLTKGGKELSVKADASVLVVRRIVDLAAAGSWPQQLDSLPPRKVVAVRV